MVFFYDKFNETLMFLNNSLNVKEKLVICLFPWIKVKYGSF